MPRRISVKGSSGSGKSTVAAELAGRLGLTYIELDALHHGPNWSEPTAEEFRAIVRQAMDVAPAGWVVDGNYDSKLGDLVVDEADMIVWLDLPISVKFPRVWRRTMHRIWKDMSSGTATGRRGGTSSPAETRSSTGRSAVTCGTDGSGPTGSTATRDSCGCAPRTKSGAGSRPFPRSRLEPWLSLLPAGFTTPTATRRTS
jgi:hypothetical protein